VVYALGEVAVAGSVEFTIAGFAPYSQYQCGAGDQYVEFIAISESDTCDHWATDQAYLMVLYAPGRDVDCSPLPEAPNRASSMRGALDLDCEWQECFPEVYSSPEAPTDHRFRVEWDVTGARLYSTEALSETPGLVAAITFDSYPNECSCECEQPLMSHVCIGRSHSSVGYFDGPAFSNVVITKSADYVPSDCCSAGGAGGQAGQGLGGTAGHAAGGSGTGGSGGAAPDGGAAVGGGAPSAPAGDADESGGCGCRSAPPRAPVAGVAVALVGVAGLFARRARLKRPRPGRRP
jgi:MYXO-CTERM domain-containing protein